MTINGITIDKSKLLSMQEIIDHLRKNEECDAELTNILDRHDEVFGNPLMWRYPISDGVNAGFAIIVVREGFMFLPYNAYDKEVYELYELEHAVLLNDEALGIFIDEWISFSNDLTSAMINMQTILRETQNQGGQHERG